jgi:hypothetical protein
MSKFKVNYYKPKNINLSLLTEQYKQTKEQNVDDSYNPYEITKLQLYNPLYKLFFDMNENNYFRVSLNHLYHIQDLETIYNKNENNLCSKKSFIKFSPLLDPYRFMIGKYDVTDERITNMPRLNSDESEIHSKVLSPHNASYIDSFFYFLTSIAINHHNVPHGINYYGSYLGIQSKFRVCLTDDVEYLRNSGYFNDNIGKLFYIEDSDSEIAFNPFLGMESSRKNKKKLNVSDSNIEIDCDELTENFEITSGTSDIESIYSKTHSNSSNSTSSSSNSELNYSSDEDSETYEYNSDEESVEAHDDNDDDDESTDCSTEEEIYGYIHNFPIQMICMEKCDGTLDDLFANDQIDETIGASILFQVVMILLIYQKMFNFTHNDLHTNNIMYIHTEEEYLHYNFNNKYYKVPTYGKIYKIIDFGRAIFKFNGRTHCSDSFAKDGDASTQYNCEPFMNENRPRLEPNQSFDLCRLGCSLFDFVTDIDENEKDLDELQKTIVRWCLDDNGKNVLYKKNGQERYPNFKLYKMIARIVHKHTPEAQLEFDYFKQFLTDTISENSLNIDNLPSYINK